MNGGRTPLVSFAVTAFNAERTIERCLRSVQAQTWPNLEILVVDDASTDSTWDLLTAFARTDPRIRLIGHVENQGAGGARNSAWRSARGVFLAFLDDDDEALPDRTTTQVQCLRDYESRVGLVPAACYCSRLSVERDGREVYARAIGAGYGEVPNGRVAANYLLTGRTAAGFAFGLSGSGTLLARVRTFALVGDFDTAFRRFQDQDWAVRLACEGGHFVGCEAALIRQHVGSRNDKRDRRPLWYALALRRKHAPYLRAQSLYWISLVNAHAKFHYARGHRWRFRGWTVVAAVLSPREVWRDWRSGRRRS
jgi:glycosyltransferase involved in cell wall biosynthesis